MDRRSEPRFETSRPATVKLLGDTPATLSATVRDISGKGLCLHLDCPLPLSAPVRIELGDSILLGEVCYCQPRDSAFAIGLVIDQALRQTAALRNLFLALSTSANPPPLPIPEPHAILSDK